MAAQYPDVKSELSAIEAAVEGYARSHAIDPSEKLKIKVLQALDFDEDDSFEPVVNAKPIREVPKIVPLKDNNFYRYSFAASLLLLLISWIALFVLYSRLQNSKEQIANLLTSNQQFSNRVNYLDKQLKESSTSLSILKNPDFKMIRLQGTKNAPSASMIVAFNPRKSEVLIDFAALKMPATDQTHQYQLWALVDGKPVDLGVFDSATDSLGMKRMKAIERAQAFAVTLEPRGGSASPTMEQMIAMGAI
nr:anti-sigma factor [Hufsiella arboris]